MPATIDPRDVEAVARAFIAAHAAFPSPDDSPAAARYVEAAARMTPEEQGVAYRQFLLTVDALPGGRLLLESIQHIH